MPNLTKPIEQLLDPALDINIPLFLDVTSLSQFATWGRDHVAELVSRIRNEGLQIVVFEAQMHSVYHRQRYDTAHKQLETFEVSFDGEEWTPDDDIFAAEVKSVYFHDESAPLCDLHAKFVVLARHASTSHTLRIISAYPCFQRLVNAEVYLLPITANDVDLPANFDLFTDLGIHPQLRKVVSGSFYQGNYVGVVQDGVQELFGYLQSLDPSFVGIDGWRLVGKALGHRNVVSPPNNNLPATPLIKLSPLTTASEKDEHKGYYHLIGGVYSALRNISGHNPPSSQVRIQRFDDKRTAVKILCFLSLLFEKIDKRVP